MAKNLNLNIDLKKLDLKQLFGSLKNVNLTSMKKYSSLFPSIAMLLAAGVIFLLTLLLGGSVSKKMNESVQAANEIRSKITQTPSEAEVAEAERYYQQYAEDADKVEALAVRTSMRELICYDPVIFPQPVDKSTQVYSRFGSHYRTAIEQLIVRIHAKDAPSEAEIRSRTGQPIGAAGGFYAGPGTTGGTQSAMVDAFCLQRADEIPVYANPEIFSWYAFWDKYTYKSQEQALKDCWYSQIAYWIYEDVIATIAELNASSAKVSQSPVKRLLGVRFDGPVQIVSSMSMGGYDMGGPMMPMGYMGTGMQGQDIPAYVKGASIYLPVPWTGRMCDDKINVIHFALAVVIDSKSEAAFMKELCSAKPHTYREKFEQGGKVESASHNQITILQYHNEPVVRNSPVHAYYRYGKEAVSQLNLICEYVFNRQGYDMIKPDPIKVELGEQPAATAAQAPTPPPQQGL